jgi:hypothetical protein
VCGCADFRRRHDDKVDPQFAQLVQELNAIDDAPGQAVQPVDKKSVDFSTSDLYKKTLKRRPVKRSARPDVSLKCSSIQRQPLCLCALINASQASNWIWQEVRSERLLLDWRVQMAQTVVSIVSLSWLTTTTLLLEIFMINRALPM